MCHKESVPVKEKLFMGRVADDGAGGHEAAQHGPLLDADIQGRYPADSLAEKLAGQRIA
jgi:hypothetical protein